MADNTGIYLFAGAAALGYLVMKGSAQGDGGGGDECGAQGQPCCDGACAEGAECVSGTCQATGGGGDPCGAHGQPCCPDGSCADGVCVTGVCVSDEPPPVPCGVPGEPCCTDLADPYCELGALCQNGNCVACGGRGQPCCPGSACNGGSVCHNGSCRECTTSADCGAWENCNNNGNCVTCGSGSNGCCDRGEPCQSGHACNGGWCDPCGAANQACCAGGTCSQGECQGGVCRTCGNEGGNCCSGNTCNPGQGMCRVNGTCGQCNYDGAPCCVGGTCQGATNCVGGTCGRCGHCDESACNDWYQSNGGCAPGLSNVGGTCRHACPHGDLVSNCTYGCVSHADGQDAQNYLGSPVSMCPYWRSDCIGSSGNDYESRMRYNLTKIWLPTAGLPQAPEFRFRQKLYVNQSPGAWTGWFDSIFGTWYEMDQGYRAEQELWWGGVTKYIDRFDYEVQWRENPASQWKPLESRRSGSHASVGLETYM